MIIHKFVYNEYEAMYTPICNPHTVYEDAEATSWNRVTCKNCLRTKAGKKYISKRKK